VRRIRKGDELLPNEPVNASPVQKRDQILDSESTGIAAQGQVLEQQHPSMVNDKLQHGQDPSLTQIYAMSNHPAGRYLVPEASNLAMPLSYPADWGMILDDGAWGDFEYEF
jgi:hypothetical protein